MNEETCNYTLTITGDLASALPAVGEIVEPINADMESFGLPGKIRIRAVLLACEISFLERPTPEKLESLRQRIERDAREAQPDWDLRVILDEKLPGA